MSKKTLEIKKLADETVNGGEVNTVEVDTKVSGCDVEDVEFELVEDNDSTETYTPEYSGIEKDKVYVNKFDKDKWNKVHDSIVNKMTKKENTNNELTNKEVPCNNLESLIERAKKISKATDKIFKESNEEKKKGLDNYLDYLYKGDFVWPDRKLQDSDRKKFSKSFNKINNRMDSAMNGEIPEYEMVKSPKHYNNYNIEVIEMMRRIWGDEDTAKWCQMTAFKYRMRMGTKPGNDVQQDLDKEKWYLDMASKLLKD